jgi:hypothetical protein
VLGLLLLRKNAWSRPSIDTSQGGLRSLIVKYARTYRLVRPAGLVLRAFRCSLPSFTQDSLSAAC